MPGSRPLAINGELRHTAAEADASLLDVLRNEFGLTATRFGCGAEACGACMVLVDGTPAYACTLPIDAIGNKAVTTLEGIGSAEHPHPLQQAFVDSKPGNADIAYLGF